MNNKNLTTIKGTPIDCIIKKLPDINPFINDRNIEIFKEHGTHNSGEYRHTCVLCERKICIDGSVSSRGNKLICNGCVYEYFDGDYAIVFHWNKR